MRSHSLRPRSSLRGPDANQRFRLTQACFMRDKTSDHDTAILVRHPGGRDRVYFIAMARWSGRSTLSIT